MDNRGHLLLIEDLLKRGVVWRSGKKMENSSGVDKRLLLRWILSTLHK